MKKISLIFNLIVFFPRMLVAQISIGLNHPELEWKVRQTEYFQIVFHQGIELLAEEAAGIAEEIYEPITTDLGVEPSHKTTIILSDYDDISNGLSYPLGHYIFLWTQPLKKYTTGRMRWLRRVIAHEFVHQVNFWGLRNFLGTAWELLGLGFMPVWFIEGVAQYEAERWDDHREMLLRVVNADVKLLSRAKLEGFIGADQIDARLVYEQGHSLVRFIAAKYGSDRIAEIIRKHRAIPISFSWSVKRALGVSEKMLFWLWSNEISLQLRDDYQSKEQATEIGTRFPSPLKENQGLRWSPDGKKVALVGIQSFDEGVSRLYICDSDGTNFKKMSGSYIGSYFSWAPDSRRLVYSKRRRGKYGSQIHDLFIFDLKTRKEHYITYNLRATDPAWSPDGKDIIFCAYQGAMSNLALYNVESQKITPITAFSAWTEVFSPSWSPDGSQIAFSIIDADGKRDIAVISRDGTEFQKLTNDFEDDRTPSWSPDAKSLAYISYRTGKPDLYIMNVDGSNQVRLTDIAGGLFNPTWAPDGKSIFVVAFEHRDQIDIVSIPRSHRPTNTDNSVDFNHSTGARWREVLPPHPAPIILSDFDKLNNSYFSKPIIEPYHSLLQIRSQLTFPNIGVDDAGLQLGIYNLSADPLGKHTLGWTITHRKRTHFFFDYRNRQYLPNVQIFVSQSSHDCGHFLERELWERIFSISSQISVPINLGRSLLANHNIGLNWAFRHHKNLYREKFIDLPESSKPFEGWINDIGLSYRYTNIQPSITYDIHPNDGLRFTISMKRSLNFLQSAYKYTQTSTSLIIRHHVFRNHRLALRLGCFIHNGDQRPQSRFVLGPSLVRGLSKKLEGDHILYSNLEYRFRIFKDTGLKFWIFYLEGVYGAPFIDAGYVWGNYLARIRDTNRLIWHNLDFAQRKFASTSGAELRYRVYFAGKFALVFRSGIAMRLDNLVKKPQAYFQIGPVF